MASKKIRQYPAFIDNCDGYVLVQGIDPALVSKNDIESIVGFHIHSYEPNKVANSILIQVGNSAQARCAVDKLNGHRFFGNVVHANVIHLPTTQPCSIQNASAQYPAHPIPISQSHVHPVQSLDHLLNAYSPCHQSNVQHPDHQPISSPPSHVPQGYHHESPLRQSPHYSHYRRSPHRSHSAQSVTSCIPTQHQQTTSPPNAACCTVKVTHLAPSVTNIMLHELFSQVGDVLGVPIIHEPSQKSDSRYAYVNFKCQSGAQAATNQLDGRVIGHEEWSIRVKLRQSSEKLESTRLQDEAACRKTLKVSNLPPGIEEEQLFAYFRQYGEIDTTSSRVLSNNSSAPYAYVNYFSSDDAASAARSTSQITDCSGVSRFVKVQIQKSKVPTRNLTMSSVSELPRNSGKQPDSSYKRRRIASSPSFQTSTRDTNNSQDSPLKFSSPVEDMFPDDVQSEETGLTIPTIMPPRECSSQSQAFHDKAESTDGDTPVFETNFNSELRSVSTDETVVVFKIKARTNVVDFQNYIDLNLKQEMASNYKVVCATRSHFDTEIQVQFQSIKEAVSSVQVLRKCDPTLEAKLAESQLDLVKLEQAVTSFKKNIEEKKNYYLSQHLQLLDDLKNKKESVSFPKKCSVEVYEEVSAKRKVLEQAIEERELQQREFKSYCEQLEKKLTDSSELLSNEQTHTISNLRKNFGVECNRFHKALPIYAHRSRIVNTVQKNKVSILIGETGSGKSTQLVQYLYDAGFSKEGTIVCTQPRKVAAISLAKHVSAEMGESKVGNVLGYKTGMRGKFCDSTKVMYMTDHTLLNECIADATFTKYSCLVIDEAHERSLSTDILLAFIKRSLSHRSDLRVIITSATIDPELFVKYFDGKCPVIKVPGRTFPVEVKWNPLQLTTSPIESNYVSDAVEVACRVHATEQPGDILVFLTSPQDIEKACKMTSDRLGEESVVLPLHGKLQPDEQQKVFSEDDPDIRKIIFATNVAETSVTIPGVKYVVDTGLAKELCFDAKRNMNSLEVRTISKSSAEQRKGRAGRTSAGKCFRLYSEDHYEDMPQKMLPEILRVALSSAVLKLYEFGVSDILSFQFVESPDPAALEAAVDSLKFLGAIENDKLTDLGRQMASLSLDPHLAKILFDGIKEGIGAEAVASVCISMLAGSVFFRAGTDEQKQESDIQKLSFLHSGGDQMTCLQTYHEWSSQPRESQNQWCVEKYVNAKSMRMIRESINEIRDVLDKKFQIQIPDIIESLNQAEKKLPKLYFKTFIRNVCVFLGHEKIGYLNLSLPDEQLVIFPGSSLRQMNEVPLYLVYEKTLKTSQHFMLQVLKVEKEWVCEAVDMKKLSQDPSQSALYHQLRVSTLTFENLGNHVLVELRKQKELVVTELNCLQRQPEFTSQKALGRLDVVLQTCHHDVVSALIRDRIKLIRKDLVEETVEQGLNRKEDNVHVIVGNGGNIRRLLMPHEYCKVVVKGPAEGDWVDEVKVKLQSCGRIQLQKEVFQTKKNEHCLFVDFQTPESAQMAVTSLECPENVYIEPIQIGNFSKGESFTLVIEWQRRSRTSCAFLNFTSVEDKIIASAQLGRSISVAGNLVKIKPSTKNECQLFLPKVELHLSEEDLKSFVLPLIPSIQPESVSVTLGREKSFKTTSEKYQALRKELNDHILQCATSGTYELNFLPPEDFHHVYKAYVKFKIPEEGQRCLQSLVTKTLDGKILTVKPNLSSLVCYQPDVYKVVKGSVENTVREIKERFPELVEIAHDKVDKRGNVLIKITSNNVPAFIAAKHALSTVINPEEIDCRTPEVREFIHTTNIKTVLSKIEKDTDTVIHIDYRTVSIKMYGTQANLSLAKMQFNESLSVFADGIKCHEIQLKKPGMPPGVMKYLVTQYGHGLERLQGRDGVKSTRLNPQRQILTVFGTSGAHQSILKLVEEYAKTINANPHIVRPNPDEIECCVCYDTTSNHLNTIRLESCGHAYCLDCITLQVSPSTLTIPVECAECSEPFVIKDFNNLYRRNVLKTSDITKVSVRSYIAANPTLVHVCPTPDCDMVYNISDDGQSYFCSQCGVTTCTKCHEPFHDGLSCEMYQAGKRGDEELEKWLRREPETRKRCPKCSAPIEKIDGCNHMHCTSCGAHICWFCLKFFDSSGGCYGHMLDAHSSWI